MCFFLNFLPIASNAATLMVACPTLSLQTAVGAAEPGDVILATGACNKNALVRNEKQRITIDGGGTATING